MGHEVYTRSLLPPLKILNVSLGSTDRVKIIHTPELAHSASLLSTESMLTKLGLNLDLPKGSPDPP